MKHFYLLLLTFLCSTVLAQDWSSIPVPADAGAGKSWELQENVSDDFNYTFNAANTKSDFGNGKWYNFYHNTWDGPGTTYWKYQNVEVKEGSLVISTSRWDQNNQANPWNGNAPKMGLPNNGVNSGCVTSHAKVQYPVYVESAISVANIDLASCFWLLSPDDTEEIDIIENYGGVDGFKHLTHISHHSFIRSPFHDYQPRDWNSWWPDSRVNTSYGWGDWAWNNGDRRYLRLGVYWKTPFHFEYYIDGALVRVMYHNAMATLMNGTWEYTYYNQQHPMGTQDAYGNNVGGQPVNQGNGYSAVTTYAYSSEFEFGTLQAASAASNGINVIDPGEYQSGNGFTKEMDIIINVESQSWLVSYGKTPTDAALADPARNAMEVDWVRVYKPVDGGNPTPPVAVTGVTITPATLDLETGATGNVTGQVIPSNADDQTITFTSNNTAVATVSQSGVVTAIAEGTAVITATSTDGGFTATSTVTVTDATVTPPNGEALIIEAEDFNRTGGTFNDGHVPFGANRVNGVGINWVNSGDYVEFDINATAGTYDVSYSISTPSNNAAISLAVNGTNAGSTNVPNNGSWDNYNTLEAGYSIQLTQGSNTLRVTASGSHDWQWNLDNITLTPVEGDQTVAVTGVTLSPSNLTLDIGDTGNLTGQVIPSNADDQTMMFTSSNTAVASVNQSGVVTAVAAGSATITATTTDGGFTATSSITVNAPSTGNPAETIVIEAEDFESTGGTFNDGFVPFGMNKVNGLGVNYVNSGDYADYTINVVGAATYDIQYMISTPMSGDTRVQLLVDGVAVSTDNVGNNGQWDDYQPLNGASVSLSEGEHTVRVYAIGSQTWQWNLDKITLTPQSSSSRVALEEAPADMYVFPNPAHGEVNISGIPAGEYTFTIYNMNGVEVYAETTSFNIKKTFDIQSLSSGIYFLKVAGKEGSYSSRILVK
ncbi:carbohydrate-binding protein [Flammeovirga sp. MY04]|uniref:Ig-like domain-containing protein n=1 Tax=Flammeovirga sp. MY04 TaxID=1191459 RepID=UPI00080618F9|nr:Ig-like domain-containing protein [Flammeovirga sp. MY04]ANQ52814.1 carbohydrate-binding protein [Flammeovirga sp. MY04]